MMEEKIEPKDNKVEEAAETKKGSKPVTAKQAQLAANLLKMRKGVK